MEREAFCQPGRKRQEMQIWRGLRDGWRLGDVLQPPEQQSGSHSGEGIPGQHWAGDTCSKIPVCVLGGVRLGMWAGLARPKSHPTESGLQGSGESEPGAGLGLGTRGENKAKPPKCIRWGAASIKQQKAGFQLRIFCFPPF